MKLIPILFVIILAACGGGDATPDEIAAADAAVHDMHGLPTIANRGNLVDPETK